MDERSEAQIKATRRNWSKYIICGALENLDQLLKDEKHELTEMEKSRIKSARISLKNLADNWNKGTDKLLH